MIKNKRLMAKIAAKKAADRKAKFDQAFILLDRANEILDNVSKECEKRELHK